MKKVLLILGSLAILAILGVLLFKQTGISVGSLIIEVPEDPNPTKTTVMYQCDTETDKEQISVTYLNADTISLVDFTWRGQRVIGANVIAASGVKFAGAQYIWWIKKDDAILYNLIDDPTEENPIRCEKTQDIR
ncbi:MliC family protein [Bartonella bacilliformis]|uniref:MliC family protein n=1 Tax=Bartonella bacilliformis TaxID=774 RepID=UPI000447C9BB|nr:MliC family protein [Bartonella bacilliformis]EYS95529.1 hypothetical protein X470_00118 [Bartonella bacilliformis Peru-18]KEG18394.1 hypothetical protein H709_00036 [Bartonella bacilliformis CUSCO5]